MNLFADALGKSRWRWIVSLVVTSALFGWGHGNQGITGIAQETLSGLLLGAVYLGCGRNLAMPIIAHGFCRRPASWGPMHRVPCPMPHRKQRQVRRQGRSPACIGTKVAPHAQIVQGRPQGCSETEGSPNFFVALTPRSGCIMSPSSQLICGTDSWEVQRWQIRNHAFDGDAHRCRRLAMYRFENVALMVALVLAAISPAHAQSTAQITGTVTDTSGSVIPGATVVITNESTSIQTTAVSNAVGNYTALFLQPGTYRIDVSLDGFQPIRRSGIRLQVAQAAQLNFQLEVGTLNETVTVVQTAPLLDASTNAMGGVVSADKIENLPIKGRNSNAFMVLAPGVRVPRVTLNQPVLESHFQFFSINGANPRQNAFVLDGGNNNDVGFNGPEYSPQVDSVQEMRVQTNNYSAEYANVAGGVINVVTKGGTNQFHGSGFEYIRDHHLQTNSYFNKRDGLDKSPMQINQFGGTLGGPIRRNKTFFFFGFEASRIQLPAGGSTTAAGLPTVITVPTERQKAGDFSQTFDNTGALVTIYDPLTTRPDPNNPGRYLRDPFPGNIIPANRINPIAAATQKYYPLPLNAGDPLTGLNNFPFTGTQPQTNNDFSIRADHQFNPSTSLMGRYSHSIVNITLPFVFPDENIADPYNSSTDQDHVSAVIKLTKSFSPTMFGEFLVSWNMFTYSRYSASAGEVDPTQLGFPGYVASSASVIGFPQMIIEGMGAGPLSSSLGFYYAEDDLYDRPGAKVNMTKVSGRHTLKFGGLVDFPRLNSIKFSNNTGSYTFGKSFTQGPDPLLSGPQSGLGFATFLLGTPTAGTYRPTTGDTATIVKYVGAHFQDDIKLTDRLTINAGIRWDYEVPRTERYDRSLNWDFTSTARLSNGAEVRGGVAFPGVDGVSRHFWDGEKTNFSPRAGFAYSLTDAPCSAAVTESSMGIAWAVDRVFQTRRLSVPRPSPPVSMAASHPPQRSPIHFRAGSARQVGVRTGSRPTSDRR